jgi:hypothetical protein
MMYNIVLILDHLIMNLLLLGGMPSEFTVCLSFDGQWGLAGHSLSLGFNLFSKTGCENSHLLIKL